MNSLAAKFPTDQFSILAVPCNQFGHQNQCTDEEVLLSLEHVRPGGGFKPAFTLAAKCEVNGSDEHDAFAFLKRSLPTPADDCGGNGADFINGMTVQQPPLWAPLRRSDISWNFEKFLVNQNGRPVRRYSPKFETENVAEDIEALLKGGPDALK